MNRLALQQRRNPAGNYRRVCSGGILAGPKHIEIPQPNRAETERAAKDPRVHFVHRFGSCIGRKCMAYVLLDFWQAGMIPVNRTTRGIDESSDVCIMRRNEHVEETRHITFMGADWIGERSWNRSESRLMQHNIHSITRAPAGRQIANISFNDADPRPIPRATGRL